MYQNRISNDRFINLISMGSCGRGGIGSLVNCVRVAARIRFDIGMFESTFKTLCHEDVNCKLWQNTFCIHCGIFRMYEKKDSTQMLLAGAEVCYMASDADNSRCFVAARHLGVYVEARRVMEAVHTIRSPIWEDYLCSRCEFKGVR